MQRLQQQPWIGLLIVLGILIAIYLPTLQTIINGSEHLMMIDVGETQIVLNTWGTLHMTGYPHYVILGNILVTIMKAIGISAATAPALVSMLWGILALTLIYALAVHLSQRPLLAMALMLVFGLMRFVWIHQVVAEIYSFSLLLLVALFALAMWKRPIPYRIVWLAILGGVAVAHYRTIAFSAPALIFITWDEFWQTVRKPKLLALCILGALAGFVPYLYLPLRARAGAEWAYGNPRTLEALWFQFRAGEAVYLFGPPESSEQFLNNWERINKLLISEISLIGVILGLVGIGVGLISTKYRRFAITLLLSALPAYGFAVGLYYDILALVILNITFALAMGWLFLADVGLQQLETTPVGRAWGLVGVAAVTIIFAVWLYRENHDFVYELTHDRTGLETIELANRTPPGDTLMIAWGPRYFAVGFAQDVEGELQHFERADHNADFASIAQESPIVTPEYTFFAHPISWWEARLQQSVYPQAIAPDLVALNTERQFAEADLPEPEDDIGVVAQDYSLTCTDDKFVLTVNWAARRQPTQNYSVLVHLLDASGAVIAQDDKFAPVFGLRPMNTWLEGEVVRDVYSFDQLLNAASIRFGLYEQLANGEFQNYNLVTIPATCGA